MAPIKGVTVEQGPEQGTSINSQEKQPKDQREEVPWGDNGDEWSRVSNTRRTDQQESIY